YWQNRADYQLHVNFNPASRLVSGVADINYSNNSPDTLKQLWFKLYPNLYKKGTPRQSSVLHEDLTDGLMIDSMWLNGKAVDVSRLNISGTNMIMNRQSVVHGQTLNIRVVYHYTLNKGSHIRTGEVEPGAAF